MRDPECCHPSVLCCGSFSMLTKLHPRTRMISVFPILIFLPLKCWLLSLNLLHLLCLSLPSCHPWRPNGQAFYCLWLSDGHFPHTVHSEVSLSLLLFPLDYHGRIVIISMKYEEKEWKTLWCNSFKTSSLLYRILGFWKVEIITGRESQRKREFVETRKEVRRWLEQGQMRHPLEHHLWAWIIQYLYKYTCITSNHPEPPSKKVLHYFGT